MKTSKFKLTAEDYRNASRSLDFWHDEFGISLLAGEPYRDQELTEQYCLENG